MTSLGLVASELEAYTSPQVCSANDFRHAFLDLSNEVSQMRLRAGHRKCFTEGKTSVKWNGISLPIPLAYVFTSLFGLVKR